MPVCVHCSAPTSALYVSYGPTHLVCTRCEACDSFADPYVEYEPIIVAIDLILVKPRAYRHILFNRQSLLSSVSDVAKGKQRAVQGARWRVVLRHCIAMLCVDAFLRWYHLCAAQRQQAERSTGDQSSLIVSLFRILGSTSILMAALHLTVNAASVSYHRLLRFASKKELIQVEKHDLERFAVQQISSSLLLSNITPMFLLILLLLWQQPFSDSNVVPAPTWQWDEASIDWVIRSLVSGLSAGVALGVILPLQRTKIGALAATSILVLGWYVQYVTSQWLQLPFDSGVGVLQTEAGRRGAAHYCLTR